MKKSIKILVIVAGAALLGALSNYFITGWYNIIPWAVAALLVGFASDTRRNAIIYGAVFGYVLFLVYIGLGYGGKTDAASMVKFLLFDAGFSLVGGVAGLVGSVSSFLLKRYQSKKK